MQSREKAVEIDLISSCNTVEPGLTGYRSWTTAKSRKLSSEFMSAMVLGYDEPARDVEVCQAFDWQ